MIYIQHRVNTVAALQDVPTEYGIETDIRYHENTLILHHDPFHHHEGKVETFEALLRAWHHKGPMILNIKTEGIEQACIELMNRYGISNWFFLDLSMPYFVLYSNYAQEQKFAGFTKEHLCVRFSDRENIAYALGFAQCAGWVWVDYFRHLSLNEGTAAELKTAGFKICLVSPELQKHPRERIDEFKRQLTGIEIDAVCTKYPHLWQEQ